MPDFTGRFSCKRTDFANKRLDERGFMDFTGHIDAQGNVSDAPHQYHEGTTVNDYTVTGSIKQTAGLWWLDLTRSDGRVIYRGFLVEDDAQKHEMAFVARKFVLQPLFLDEKKVPGVKPTLLDQTEEPWVITKP
jgi:hypothetical protein